MKDEISIHEAINMICSLRYFYKLGDEVDDRIGSQHVALL
jgi:hypothetical protein